MTLAIPFAFLAAAAEGGHGEEETISDVVMHHISNADMNLWPFDLVAPFSKAALFMVIAVAILIPLLGYAFRRSRITGGAPTGLTNALEAVVVFVRDDIAITNMGKKYGRMFTPFLCTLFFFILMCNLLGMVPGGYAATSNLNVTGTLSLITLALMILSGMVVMGPIGYFKHMVPAGTPIVIVPLLVVIEVISTFVKPIALTIRLGANMTAGHIVILVMMSFVFIFQNVFVGMFVSVPMAVAVSLLELIVAFIQAYVFTLLTAIFIGMMVHSAH
ncbi:MAG: F0F1 ATP synthase subunit A [Gammaproteobacteria bacterium]|nr:F0F1 ATP synthase subunit A [Gammaproteobacteria bacterium]